jgi:hypothetical protein
MSIEATFLGDAIDEGGSAGANAASRVLVVFERGRAGTAALRVGAEIAEAGAELSVVTLAPQAAPSRCCGGGGPGPYNCAVRAEADMELGAARILLGSASQRASFTVLVGHPAPPLSAWVAEHGFGIVVVPARRLSRAGGRLARSLRRTTAAEVRLVRWSQR